MHGTPGGRITYWQDPTIDARHGLRRITYDRPGYGESTRLAGRSVADVVTDVEAITAALGIDRFVVSGGSGGGPHCLATAAVLPDRVNSLPGRRIDRAVPVGWARLARRHDRGQRRGVRSGDAGGGAPSPHRRALSARQCSSPAEGRAHFLGAAYRCPRQTRRSWPSTWTASRTSSSMALALALMVGSTTGCLRQAEGF